MFEATDEAWRTELATRESNGITVRLFWSRSKNLVTVAVADTANDDGPHRFVATSAERQAR